MKSKHENIKKDDYRIRQWKAQPMTSQLGGRPSRGRMRLTLWISLVSLLSSASASVGGRRLASDSPAFCARVFVGNSVRWETDSWPNLPVAPLSFGPSSASASEFIMWRRAPIICDFGPSFAVSTDPHSQCKSQRQRNPEKGK